MTTLVDSPITQDAAWFVGEDKLLTFTVYLPGTTRAQVEAAPTANRQDITGWTLTWVLRKTRYSAAATLTKTGGSIVILTQTGSTLGQFTVSIARADTTPLKAGTYHHGAARTNSGAWDVITEGAAVLRKAAVI